MNKDEKKEFVEVIRNCLSNSKSVIITHYHGLSVEDLTLLRSEMRVVDANYKIVKNSLARLAIVGTDFEKLEKFFTGPVAIAFSEDPVAAAKSLVKFAKTKDSLKILGGVVEKQLIDEKGVRQLSQMPSLDELRAKIVGVLNAPATKLAGVIQAPASQIARVIGAYAAKQ